ncbi:tetratricopeptide repeat-containing sulfotransferase family protein [Parerythrobacter lacustris]|uniref:Sulfotransferase n=1 Tax=Parerythrobacter lacustris TaxID=2969984 RepID=A0ABT1XMF3_9SPHN|nr:sulfotransferase [Parerythrobacter lacustris]MCR2832835.1 sulfotransferase [Parerythrobacter lacustris]
MLQLRNDAPDEQMAVIEAKRQLRAGALERAYQLALETLSRDRGNGEAWGIMSLVALEGGNIMKSLELSGKALDMGAVSALVRGGRGRALLAAGRQDEARDLAADTSLDTCKDALEADTIGVILARTGLHEEALPYFERAVCERPDVAQFGYNLATSLQFTGRLDEAKRSYASVLDTDPAFHRARLALVQLQNANEHDLSALDDLFEFHRQEIDSALQLGHAAARICEARGDHAGSLDWLFKAKRAKAAQVAYDRDWADRLFAAAKTRDVAKIACANGSSAAAPAPVFVLGMPRSGTTLVERILSSHPEVATAGELPDFALLVKRSSEVGGPHTLSPELLKARYDPAATGKAYFARTSPLAGGHARLIDKMPFNLFFAAHILESLPLARIVMVRRDPRDTVFANFRQLFATDFGYYDYAYDLEDTAHFVAGFVDLADHWLRALPPDRYTEVRYEQLVAEQEAQSRRLVDFLGLEWDEACLRFHRNTAPVATASSVQVRAPIHSKSVGQWQRYGEAAERVERALRSHGVPLP